MTIKAVLPLLLLSAAGQHVIAQSSAGVPTAEELRPILAREIVGASTALGEIQDYLEKRVPILQTPVSDKDWTLRANRMRKDILDRVVLRGEAARWDKASLKVEWLETIPGGPGYHIRKLRYEAVPGLWIPALLYEPESFTRKAPVVLDVNGHDATGMPARYKQIICINQAKRGMLALNVEWLGMGQLSVPNYAHGRMNQLDLCGTSGLAPFYLAMKRGLDVLLAHPHADRARVAVTGYSGGGWQTIFISALDPRVTLANPVAGYSSFRTRIRHLKDLGDPEQTPCDLATVADYTHLTAMMAPRPTLLTYNAKDECCFEAGYALPPLLEAARPIFELFGAESRLRWYINTDPGTHNYEQDNRQAFYRMVRDYFYGGDAGFDAQEIPCDGELKSKEELAIALPEPNADFNSLALKISKNLPHVAGLPAEAAALHKWQERERARLRQVIRAKDYTVRQATPATCPETNGFQVTDWRLRVNEGWTLPATEMVLGQPKGVTVVIADAGRRSLTNQVAHSLAAGQRVVATDPFYFGESKPAHHDFLWPLLMSAVGSRPLGVQAGQVAAIARWVKAGHPGEPVTLCAVGPRACTVALVAAGLEEMAVARLELRDPFPSLKTVIEQNRRFEEMPEMFCFGLLEAFDIEQLEALLTPRTVVINRGFNHR